MKLLAALRERSTNRAMQDRLVWQAASLLLAYPDDGLASRLDAVDELIGHISGPPAALLGQTVEALRAREPMAAAMDYVATFDMRRRCTMYLTYWTAGDTRNRGREMLAFATAYREAGVQPPGGEAPDHLTVVLEFAPPSIPRPAGDCWTSTACRSTCCAAPWPTPSRPTSRRWRRSARPCPPQPIRKRAAPSGWRKPDRRRKLLGCNRLP